jgi:hypothetical protein
MLAPDRPERPTLSLLDLLSTRLDDLARPDFRIFGREVSAFQVWGVIALVAAILLTLALTARQGLSLLMMGGVILAGVGTFFTLAMATKVITGEERLVYYHHAIAVIAVTAVLVKLMGQPALAYVDITVLGLGMFLAVARLGCLSVGCCHGRPHRWGVCYGEAHVHAGFPAYLQGVRLFPVQAMESLWVLSIVAVGIWMLVGETAPGAVLAWYVLGYGAGRILLEFKRGDAVRPYAAGISGAQWTSLVFVTAVIAAEISGLLAFQSWHAALALAAASALVVNRLRESRAHPIVAATRDAQRLREIIETLNGLSSARDQSVVEQPEEICAATTTSGLRISWSRFAAAERAGDHYALSCADSQLTGQAAEAVIKLILIVRHPSQPYQLISGHSNVFHLLVFPQLPLHHGAPWLKGSGAQSS